MKNVFFNIKGINKVAQVFYDPTVDEMIVVKANTDVESFIIDKGNVVALMANGQTEEVTIIEFRELGMVA